LRKKLKLQLEEVKDLMPLSSAVAGFLNIGKYSPFGHGC